MPAVELFDSRDSADAEPHMTILGQPVVQTTFSASTVVAMGSATPLDSPDDLFPLSQEPPDPIVPSKLPAVLDDVPTAAINNMRLSSSSPSDDVLPKSSSSNVKAATPSKGRRKASNN
jgi:hypothetical protein